jgi:hypothetical protein
MGDDAGHAVSLAVRPYLEELVRLLEKRGERDHSVSIPVGSGRVLVSPLEQRLAIASIQDDPRQPLHRHCLVRDSVGLQVKIHSDLRALAQAASSRAGELQRRVDEDLEMALQMQRALAGEVRRLGEAGRLDRARELQEYLTRLTEAIRAIERQLGGEPGAVAQGCPSRGAPPARGNKPPEDGATEAPATPVRPSRGERVKVGVAAGLGVLLVLILSVMWYHRQRELRPLSLHDFVGIDGVEQIIPRPPDVLVVLAEGTWQRLDAETKDRVARRAGEVARGDGYRRVVLRTRTQPLLAEWHRGVVTVHR